MFDDDGPSVVTVPGSDDPFDPDIDPSTLERPKPDASSAPERSLKRKDVPITADVPADKQFIPPSLALPAGTALYFQEEREWIVVELKADAEPIDSSPETAEPPLLQVRRTDRPAVIPDVLIARDQLLISKLVVRRLERARK
ncbi:MAG: hypothetical protein AAF907_16355 [Planctomycetota bacterium]